MWCVCVVCCLCVSVPLCVHALLCLFACVCVLLFVSLTRFLFTLTVSYARKAALTALAGFLTQATAFTNRAGSDQKLSEQAFASADNVAKLLRDTAEAMEDKLPPLVSALALYVMVVGGFAESWWVDIVFFLCLFCSVVVVFFEL